MCIYHSVNHITLYYHHLVHAKPMISPREERLGEDVSGVSQALCLKVQQHLTKGVAEEQRARKKKKMVCQPQKSEEIVKDYQHIVLSFSLNSFFANPLIVNIDTNSPEIQLSNHANSIGSFGGYPKNKKMSAIQSGIFHFYHTIEHGTFFWLLVILKRILAGSQDMLYIFPAIATASLRGFSGFWITSPRSQRDASSVHSHSGSIKWGHPRSWDGKYQINGD